MPPGEAPLSSPITAPGRLVGPRVPALASIEPQATTRSLRAPYSQQHPQGREIDTESLKILVQRALAGKLANDHEIHYGDTHFYLPTLAEVALILQASHLDRKKWMQERFDCDDFAYVLKGEMSAHAYDAPDLHLGLCSGIVWGCFDWTGDEFHAVNWAVTSDEVVWLIEPQTDDIYPIERCTGGISLLLV